MWRPVVFSAATIAQHVAQADRTQCFRCPKCSLEIYLPRIVGTPEFYDEAYNLSGQQAASDFGYSASKWDFGAGLRDIRAGERILEVGCGPGHFLALARSRGATAVGVEFNGIAAAQARAKGFVVYDSLDEVADALGSFDRVFAFHVLEHVAEPVVFVRQLQAFVRDGGAIGLATPNQAGPVRFIEPCIQNMPPHHATRWSEDSFIALARGLNLRVEGVRIEPLTRESVYYYSLHGVTHAVNGVVNRVAPAAPWSGTVRRRLGRAVERGLDGFLRLRGWFGAENTSILSGQSIYVLLTKESTGPSVISNAHR